MATHCFIQGKGQRRNLMDCVPAGLVMLTQRQRRVRRAHDAPRRGPLQRMRPPETPQAEAQAAAWPWLPWRRAIDACQCGGAVAGCLRRLLWAPRASPLIGLTPFLGSCGLARGLETISV